LISASRATCEVLGENRDPTIYICVVVDATWYSEVLYLISDMFW
jgi:hypothetical protein